MKLVIDIPEWLYKETLRGDVDSLSLVEIAIRNGMPLPKGHGRLIDADALDIDNLDCAYDGNFELDYGRLYTEDVVNMIESALTIIEADKGE